MSDTRTYSGVDLDECELHPLGLGLAAVYTRRSPDKDTMNEDSVGLIPVGKNAGVLIVADGAGGRPSGAKASEIAVRTIAKQVEKVTDTDGLRSAILDAIEQANQAIVKLGIGAATTLAVAEIRGDTLRTYHAGDSQIFLFGQRGKLKIQTVSHSPVGYAVESGLLDQKEAMFHDERHLISNMLGTEDMKVEMGSVVEISANDTIVVGSDGLFDNMTPSEIIEAARKGQLLAACRSLVDTCHARMLEEDSKNPSKPDDLSIVAYRRRVSAS